MTRHVAVTVCLVDVGLGGLLHLAGGGGVLGHPAGRGGDGESAAGHCAAAGHGTLQPQKLTLTTVCQLCTSITAMNMSAGVVQS